ncbi:prepilin-type N-terminal cleavage/methylation domain-containing protein [Halobacillus shinanisalinarum]|uniref:Prepilin-type N-terminal cleavage/methylation domain-containing protein n=1 Tax=Halobacillus shinanisalinarum TaxID=2932258 RepID=A0ABY4H419_9BACI|nr:ComGF family competence protein [Halobacillus shinanisalinarum]UOQ93727.1 prepilin-type N-terminal cleavage/methylation domain-containing protein [Halobacillus shinanisalinarum]
MLAINSKGFTLVETLFCLTLLSIMLTISIPLLKLIESPAYSHELSAIQFFTFVEEEINTSTKVKLLQNELFITDTMGRIIRISKYGDSVRRQVNDTGHELLITNIQAITFNLKEGNDILTVHLTLKEGTAYDKTIYIPS